ncbi:restriction endonuclease subunit S [Tenacibaculum finnmarkense]|uniref:restriction endonuclease subunit S n=1 Tax=Tenacibaculum finnmarkense TaxID=2781243 RepID=UPI001E3A8210|nr:restriction endonuclease subunit S [Tenacibaculum finnmarkense]MCD8411489.1 restriction endonuclease subunit S [Tenacibaculum finnmarkense genomovar ulcerans]
MSLSIKNIPSDWELKKLGEIAKTFAGGTPKRSIAEYYNGTIPWIKSGEVNNDSIITSSEFVTELALKESSTRLIKPNSILIAMYGATAGKVGVLKVLGCSNQAVLAVNSEIENLSNVFLYHYLKKCTVELLNLCQGSGQPNLSKAIVDNLKIPLPPLKEQQKIAEILSTVDAKISIIDEQISENKNLKKGLMQSLLSKGIGHTEFKKSALGEIPKSWEVVKIQDIADVNKESLANSTDKNYELFYIDLSSVKSGVIDLPTEKIKFSDAPSRARRKIKKDDVIMATVRPNLLGYGYIDFKENDYFVSTGFVVLSYKENFNGRFLYQYLYSEVMQLQIEKLIVGSSYPAINSSDVKHMKIPLLPLQEQQKIASILNSVDEKLGVLSEKKSYYQNLKKGLMQQLLTGLVRVEV